ncbi:MAG: hypothetical protein LQ351_004427 [Letrouitia transgressa]|nr:MAG: hypothetical protein LQ351_004427 [Letrouitia transgressa]
MLQVRREEVLPELPDLPAPLLDEDLPPDDDPLEDDRLETPEPPEDLPEEVPLLPPPTRGNTIGELSACTSKSPAGISSERGNA